MTQGTTNANATEPTGTQIATEGGAAALLTGGVLAVLNHNGITPDDVVIMMSAAGGALSFLRWFRWRRKG